MATAGTLIADLQPSLPSGDGDYVQKILADMNISNTPAAAAPTQRPLPPPLPAQAPVYQQQMAPSMQQMTMDNQIPTSHMIGNQHPTPADFSAAVQGAPYGAPMPGVMAQQQHQQVPQNSEQKNFYGRLLDEIKVPFIVALLFFAFSLPPIRVLIAHYIPSLIKQTGEFQVYGLLAVSGMVGLSFWLLQRVIAPLLSL
jgi:hypothetical protein